MFVCFMTRLYDRQCKKISKAPENNPVYLFTYLSFFYLFIDYLLIILFIFNLFLKTKVPLP